MSIEQSVSAVVPSRQASGRREGVVLLLGSSLTIMGR